MTSPLRQDVTVLIPTLGRPVLERVLYALEAGSVWPAEIVVVDQSLNGQARPLAEAFSARGLQVRWVPCAGRGRALGLNTGLGVINAGWVLITDDDCLPDPQWLVSTVRRLEGLPAGLVTGRVDAESGTVQLSVVTRERESLQRRPALRFDHLSGGNMGAHRNTLSRIGPFTTLEVMRYSEDGDYAYRALRAGVPILYAPECRVTHLAWRDSESRQDQYRYYAQSQAGFLGYYSRAGHLIIWLRTVVHLVRSTKRWLLSSLVGQREQALNGRYYVIGFFSGFLAGWHARASKTGLPRQ